MHLTVLETISQSSEFNDSTEKSSPKADGVKVYQWTQKEYYKLADLGFFDGKRVELIEGEIIEMAPMNKPHATAVRMLLSVLRKLFGADYLIDSQLPMSFSKKSEPEPDVAIIKGSIEDFKKSHPKTAELIVEVSDSTLRYDRTAKVALYARNSIREYWILNLRDSVLEVHRQPKKDKNLGFIYAEKLILNAEEQIEPLFAPNTPIKIADILP